MIRQSTACLLLLLSVPLAYVAGRFIERTTSAVSAVIPPHFITSDADHDLAKSAELDEINRDLRQRIGLKQMLVAELLAGRTSLATVTAQFLVLNQERAGDMDVIRSQFSGSTDTEKTARNVISHAAYELSDCGAVQRMLILARIECEFRQIVT